MSAPSPPACSVLVAIITSGQRPSLAQSLHSLSSLTSEATHPLHLSVLVVDNSPQQAARALVEACAQSTSLPIRYHHEPEPGIPFARNAALRACGQDSDFLAFLDDDETAAPNWLAAHLATLAQTGADASGGPVAPIYPAICPAWLRASGVFERASKREGQSCRVLATNNCMIRLSRWRQSPHFFDVRLRYTGSSDTLFFREAHARGWSLVWSAQAQVDEPVAPERLALNWVFKRNYRIGNGLCLCTRLQHGWGRALLWHSLRATGQLALAGKALLGSPITGRAGLVRAACRVARACGELTGLAGHCYEEYAPRPA